jgi:hypothetical protein
MSTMSRRAVLVSLFTALITVTSGCGSSSSPPNSPAISVSVAPSSPQGIDQAQTVNITATVTNDTSSQGVTWSLIGPGSLSSSAGPSVTYSSPTASLTAPQQVTVTATSAADPTKSASLPITVNPYLRIPVVQALANGSVGTPYSQTITFSGGTAPFQWSVYDGPILTGYRVGGAVPDGLALNAMTGVVSGTPTGGGTWYFEATVTDATGATSNADTVSIQINPGPPLANPLPFLNQTLVPTAVAPGEAAFTLSVSGAEFVSGSTIDFNGAPLTTTFVDSDHLTAMVPAASVATARTAAITVVNPAPGGGASNVVYFPIGASETAISFAAAANSPIQTPGASGLAVADFNEDGKPDLAASAAISVYTFLGNGDGTFAAASGSPMPVLSPPFDDFPTSYVWTVIAGDFNNNGHQGLAVSLFQDEAVDILFGNGNGTFAYADTLANAMGQPTVSLTAADFNADGYLDLVAVNTTDGVSPNPLLGYGHGAFNAVSENIQVSGISSAAGDFNRDGKLDLVIDGASILLGNGDGTFTQGTTLNVGDYVVVADFNADGKLDLAIASSLNNNVTILLGDGTGSFSTASGSPITVGDQPQAIIAADFNNDGKLDLAVANSGDGTVTLLLGNGDGTFTTSSGSPYAVGQSPTSIAAADFNGDGKLDLAVANSTGVSILLQQ